MTHYILLVQICLKSLTFCFEWSSSSTTLSFGQLGSHIVVLPTTGYPWSPQALGWTGRTSRAPGANVYRYFARFALPWDYLRHFGSHSTVSSTVRMSLLDCGGYNNLFGRTRCGVACHFMNEYAPCNFDEIQFNIDIENLCRVLGKPLSSTPNRHSQWVTQSTLSMGTVTVLNQFAQNFPFSLNDMQVHEPDF